MTLKPVGPLCQTKDWYDYAPDGLLRRRQAIRPGTLGMASAPSAQGGKKAVALGKCSFLNRAKTETVAAPKAVFDRLRGLSGGAKVSAPRPKTSHTWPDGSRSAAVEQEIAIDGQTIQVTRPTDTDAKGKNLPTTQQLAEALRAVPADQRLFTKTVVLSPTPAKGSTPKATVAGEGGSGEVFLYPLLKKQDQQDFDNRVMHEAGHNLQGDLWNSGGGQAVVAWGVAAKADDTSPSPYSDGVGQTGDDFCEFNILYNAAKGTPCEEVAKQIYPQRWAKRESY
ncbi:MAG TPA: hypothetical protein VE907_15455 [Gammaproteobacteria bacterium]|nr:hypothetical protein [Gammaproteobacteria bacterium]